jgi:hypothetical protein
MNSQNADVTLNYLGHCMYYWKHVFDIKCFVSSSNFVLPYFASINIMEIALEMCANIHVMCYFSPNGKKRNMSKYFIKIFSIKFYENMFSGSRVATGYAGRQTNIYTMTFTILSLRKYV